MQIRKNVTATSLFVTPSSGELAQQRRKADQMRQSLKCVLRMRGMKDIQQ